MVGLCKQGVSIEEGVLLWKTDSCTGNVIWTRCVVTVCHVNKVCGCGRQ